MQKQLRLYHTNNVIMHFTGSYRTYNNCVISPDIHGTIPSDMYNKPRTKSTIAITYETTWDFSVYI